MRCNPHEGEGAYSVVYKVKRVTDGVDYALKKIKLMDLKEKERERSQRN